MLELRELWLKGEGGLEKKIKSNRLMVKMGGWEGRPVEG